MVRPRTGNLKKKILFRYTEHSSVGLGQQYDQLNQLGMRIKHNLEQQIQARNQSGVSEDALKEFSMMFRHFDKDKTGRLDHQQFKSCLRALGYDLPVVEADQPEPEFEAILAEVDTNHDGYISLQVNFKKNKILLLKFQSFNCPFIYRITWLS